MPTLPLLDDGFISSTPERAALTDRQPFVGRRARATRRPRGQRDQLDQDEQPCGSAEHEQDDDAHEGGQRDGGCHDPAGPADEGVQAARRHDHEQQQQATRRRGRAGSR